MEWQMDYANIKQDDANAVIAADVLTENVYRGKAVPVCVLPHETSNGMRIEATQSALFKESVPGSTSGVNGDREYLVLFEGARVPVMVYGKFVRGLDAIPQFNQFY